MDLGSGDTDTQTCIKCCFRRDEVKSIKEKWQLQCKKVGPERTHRILQKRHRQDFTLELASISIVIHIVRLLSLYFMLQTRQADTGEPDPFQCSWKGGGILTVCFISRLASHFQEILRLRTMENGRNRERVTAQTLNAGPDKTYKKRPALGWAKHFQTQTQPPSLAIVQTWKFPFCREIWWEMWLGVQDEIMCRSQLLSWIRFFQIVKLSIIFFSVHKWHQNSTVLPLCRYGKTECFRKEVNLAK